MVLLSLMRESAEHLQIEILKLYVHHISVNFSNERLLLMNAMQRLDFKSLYTTFYRWLVISMF